MKLENRILRLIAVGASISANCQPCLQINMAKAREEGIDDQEIAEAIDVGKRVRQGAATKMDKFVANLGQTIPLPIDSSSEGCGCGS